MAVTRSLTNGNIVVDYTDEVLDIPNQYGYFNASGLFTGGGVATESILFDVDSANVTMMPQTNRRLGNKSHGADRTLKTYSIALPHFERNREIFPADVQGWRKGGTPDQAEDLPNVIMKKMTDLKFEANQTQEYMKINAIKGTTIDPEGTTIVAMHTLLGSSGNTIDFALGTSTTNIDAKIAEAKRYIAKNAKLGGAIGGIDVVCSPEFFDALVNHPNLIAAYNYFSAGSGPQLNRDDLAIYEKWGVMDVFRHKGITFYSYDAVFSQPDGTEVRAFGTTSTAITKQEGYTLVKGIPGLYQAYYGPQNTLGGANNMGREMFITEYRDPRDKFIDLELEMSPLYFVSKPLVSVRCYTTN